MNEVNNKFRFEELLTPYVQNRLDASERRFVEELAKNNSELNEKLQFEIELAGYIQQQEKEFIDIDVESSFGKLKQQIESTSNNHNWWNIFSWKNNDTFGGFNPSLVIASFAVVCIGVYVLLSQYVYGPLEPGYETLSNNEPKIVYEQGRQYYRVVVKESLTVSKLQTLADEFTFNIESGPDSLNSYIISSSANNSTQDVNLHHLRKDPRFLLIEPLPGVNTEN